MNGASIPNCRPGPPSRSCAASKGNGSKRSTGCSPRNTGSPGSAEITTPAPGTPRNPVNLALSAANVCLYGVVHSALLALGCSPALGFIHSGTQHAFIYDIADLYKAKITIPLAFSHHSSTRPEQAVRRHLREKFRLFRLLPRIVTDVQYLLDPGADPDHADRTPDMVHLWDPELGPLPAGVNYADDE